MSYTIEKEWETRSGLKAVCLFVGGSHRCGYVAIGKEHPLWGVAYHKQAEMIRPEMVEALKLGKRGPLIAFTAEVGGDVEGAIRRSPDILFDVHGGLTYSSDPSTKQTGKADYPIPSEGLWWFGFDCAHADDATMRASFTFGGTFRTLEYVVDECETLAEQLATFAATGGGR